MKEENWNSEYIYNSLLRDIYNSLSDDTTKSVITSRIKSQYDDPPVLEFELFLRRSIPREALRELIFAPNSTEDEGDPESIVQYAVLLRATGQTLHHSHPLYKPQTLVRSVLISFLYMSHLHSWKHAAAFCRAGGLNALFYLLQSDIKTDDDLGARNVQQQISEQALDCLLIITSHPSYDWHEPPMARDDNLLHQEMLSIGTDKSNDSTDFFKILLPEPLPSLASLYHRVQLLAFWLGWVRKLHTEGKPLYVSHTLINRLDSILQLPDISSAPVLDQANKQESCLIESSLRDLCTNLREDFSRFCISQPNQIPQAGDQSSSSSIRMAGGMQSIGGTSDESHGGTNQSGKCVLTTIDASAVERISEYKESGDSELIRKNWEKAIACYSNGIDFLGLKEWSNEKQTFGCNSYEFQIAYNPSTVANLNCALLSDLYTNRSIAFLRLSGYGSGTLPPSSFLPKPPAYALAHLESTKVDSQKAICLDANNIKARFYFLLSLVGLGLHSEAHSVATTNLQHLLQQKSALPGDLKQPEKAPHPASIKKFVGDTRDVISFVRAFRSSSAFSLNGAKKVEQSSLVSEEELGVGNKDDIHSLEDALSSQIFASLVQQKAFGGVGKDIDESEYYISNEAVTGGEDNIEDSDVVKTKNPGESGSLNFGSSDVAKLEGSSSGINVLKSVTELEASTTGQWFQATAVLSDGKSLGSFANSGIQKQIEEQRNVFTHFGSAKKKTLSKPKKGHNLGHVLRE